MLTVNMFGEYSTSTVIILVEIGAENIQFLIE
jgi:hypothetical protein